VTISLGGVRCVRSPATRAGAAALQRGGPGRIEMCSAPLVAEQEDSQCATLRASWFSSSLISGFIHLSVAKVPGSWLGRPWCQDVLAPAPAHEYLALVDTTVPLPRPCPGRRRGLPGCLDWSP